MTIPHHVPRGMGAPCFCSWKDRWITKQAMVRLRRKYSRSCCLVAAGPNDGGDGENGVIVYNTRDRFVGKHMGAWVTDEPSWIFLRGNRHNVSCNVQLSPSTTSYRQLSV